MIFLGKTLVIFFFFTLCQLEVFGLKHDLSGVDIGSGSSFRANTELGSCPATSETQEQLLEKLMTPEEFKKEFGADSLDVVRNDSIGEVKPVPLCKKECKARGSVKGCFWTCPTAPFPPPPLPDHDIKFLLYTSSKPTMTQTLTSFTDAPWKGVELEKGAPTIIICHGFKSGPTKGPEKLGDEYFKYYKSLKPPVKVNIILVDWSNAARVWQKHRDTSVLKRMYFPPAVYVQGVGYQTKILIRKLMARANIKLDQIHLIGHSLGAQAMGYAGKFLALDSDLNHDRQVARLTALDPAGPCFEHNLWNALFCIDRAGGYQAVSKDDAQFVDVIHSNARLLGMINHIGHVDFYPNGGKHQPGCSCLPLKGDVCSHSRAFNLMAASINHDKNKYKGVHCRDIEAALKEECKAVKDVKFNFMGQNVDKDPKNHGIYYLPTLEKEPFSSKLKL